MRPVWPMRGRLPMAPLGVATWPMDAKELHAARAMMSAASAMRVAPGFAPDSARCVCARIPSRVARHVPNHGAGDVLGHA